MRSLSGAQSAVLGASGGRGRSSQTVCIAACMHPAPNGRNKVQDLPSWLIGFG